jgi:hypothetical protein
MKNKVGISLAQLLRGSKPRSESRFSLQIDYRPKAGLKAIWRENRLPPLIRFMIPE